MAPRTTRKAMKARDLRYREDLSRVEVLLILKSQIATGLLCSKLYALARRMRTLGLPGWNVSSFLCPFWVLTRSPHQKHCRIGRMYSSLTVFDDSAQSLSRNAYWAFISNDEFLHIAVGDMKRKIFFNGAAVYKQSRSTRLLSSHKQSILRQLRFWKHVIALLDIPNLSAKTKFGLHR